MDDNLYDEFGNYIGPEIEEESSDEEAEEKEVEEERDHEAEGQHEEAEGAMIVAGEAYENAVVLHEDKKYFPTAEEVRDAILRCCNLLYWHGRLSKVYGPEVETRVEDEDTQPLTEPIVAPIKTKNFDVVEKEVREQFGHYHSIWSAAQIPETTFSASFLTSLMDCPQLIRSVCLLGHLHHGKTTLMDMLVMQTHENVRPTEKGDSLRYTDTRLDEQERGISLKWCEQVKTFAYCRSDAFPWC